MIASRVFDAEPSSVKLARRFVDEQLGAIAPDAAQDVTLMVSELATNCIRHAESGFTVTISKADDVLRVEVVGTGPGLPQLRNPLPTDPTGRGLQIVAALSHEWGIAASTDTGSTVWFVVNLNKRHPAGPTASA